MESIDFSFAYIRSHRTSTKLFLINVDVDYSGGKDMSFIESSGDARNIIPIAKDDSEEPEIGTNHALQHYPNGINLSGGSPQK